jgi:hypothetical protein
MRRDRRQPSLVQLQYSNAEPPADALDDWEPPEESWRDAPTG